MSSYPSYIPAQDGLFSTWLANFEALLSAAPATYGLDATDATNVNGVNSIFQAAYTLAIDPYTRTSPTVADKDAARASAEATVRPLAVRVSANAGVTNEDKLAIGVTVRSTVPTPIPPPTEAPTIGIESAIPLQQLLTSKVAGTVGKAKPFGSVSLEVYRSVGVVAATDPTQALFIGLYTKSPFRQNFIAEDQGKIVTYFCRYNTRSGPEGESQTGPWSAPLNLSVM